ncbi:hypothetical protein [Steroidobacter cummioxidans]|uniref:hypothetical protein n=1 Tax=Steroidobacter cummioxidans TaxID=1803913 RepID=UPI000E311F88|nr:hypothetical protein [Steroidobacter cummioxidans]
MDSLIRFIVVTIALAAVIIGAAVAGTLAVKWARKGSPMASFASWAMLLPTAGMNPKPPPQEQVEDANRERTIKKENESGADV